MSEIKINKKIIGNNHPVYIIADIGINHQGNVDIAKELILQAKDCGADCLAFPFGESITLHAVADPGSHFVQWTSGKCTKDPNTPTDPECTFPLPASNLVKAQFDLD